MYEAKPRMAKEELRQQEIDCFNKNDQDLF